jgi:hypothetical protein
MSHIVPKLNDPSLLKTNVAYVNGEWVKAQSGKTFEVTGMAFFGVDLPNPLSLFLLRNPC